MNELTLKEFILCWVFAIGTTILLMYLLYLIIG